MGSPCHLKSKRFSSTRYLGKASCAHQQRQMVGIVLEKMLHCSLLKLGSSLRIIQSPVKSHTFLGGLIVAPSLGEVMSREPQVDKPIIFYLVLE